MDEFKPSFKGRRIYRTYFPCPRSCEAMRPELDQKKENEQKVGRNDPCPCGSGKKYKNVVGSEKVTASISAIDYTPIFQKEMNVI